MKKLRQLLGLGLLTGVLGWAIPLLSAEDHAKSSSVYLTASQLNIAKGQPSLVSFKNSSVYLPVWSLSGVTEGQSVAGVIPHLPKGTQAIKLEIVVIASAPADSNENLEDVYRVHLSQLPHAGLVTDKYNLGKPIRTPVPFQPSTTRRILLEPYYEVHPDRSLYVRIQREPADPADTYTKPMGLVMVVVTPVKKPEDAYLVEGRQGYNSWPMMQAVGNKLVCVYSRGSGHTIGEDQRACYARTSIDGGSTWSDEKVVANTPAYGEVPVGKGLDEKGAMLLWIRRVGKERIHDLYRTVDGLKFKLISTPNLAERPMQITDVFTVPSVGLMALWFAGDYGDKPTNSWGTLVSRDNGLTWEQNIIESGLPKADWPTEQAAVYLGDGKILAIARTELSGLTTDRAQFQLESHDYGKTWTKRRTNIGNVANSTPSLILDSKTGLLSNYYYERGRGVIYQRVVKPSAVLGKPLSWPEPRAVGVGSDVMFDAGNVNATVIGDHHYLSYYSGKGKHTSVYVKKVKSPEAMK